MLKTLKNHLFTKVICSTLLLSSLTISAPQKAEAGLALFVAPFVAVAGTPMIAAGVASGSVIAISGIGLGVYSNKTRDLSESMLPWIGIMLFALDENAPVDSQIEAGLAQRYSFIEDRTVISHLAQVITERTASAPLEADGSRIARLSREEITEILAPTDLLDTDTYSAEVEAMIQELQ